MLVETVKLKISPALPNLEVVNASYQYGINNMPTATITLQPSSKVSTGSIEGSLFQRKDLIGNFIRLIWSRETQSSMILFEGIVTGISTDKASTSEVSYSITCTGGPTGLYNTTLSSAGWFPQGIISDRFSGGDISHAIVATEITSILGIMETIVGKFSSVNTENFLGLAEDRLSQAALDQLQPLTSILQEDLGTFNEASILSEHFGNVGELSSFQDFLEGRIIDLLQGSSSSTYWNFLISLCSEIGINVVPWTNKVLLIPDMLFTDAIKANVLFPSQITSISVGTDPFEYPEQVAVPIDTETFLEPSNGLESNVSKSCVVFPKTEDLPQEFVNPYPGRRFLSLMRPPPYVQWILQDEWEQYHKETGESGKDESRKSIEETAAKREDFHITYASNFAEYYYHKVRTAKDSGQVTATFSPLMVPGFSAYIIDGQSTGNTGVSYKGLISGVSHSITNSSASTSISLTNILPLFEDVRINNPLHVTLTDQGGNVGPSVLSGTQASSVSEHITPASAASNTSAKTDPEAAARFTGRIS